MWYIIQLFVSLELNKFSVPTESVIIFYQHILNSRIHVYSLIAFEPNIKYFPPIHISGVTNGRIVLKTISTEPHKIVNVYILRKFYTTITI